MFAGKPPATRRSYTGARRRFDRTKGLAAVVDLIMKHDLERAPITAWSEAGHGLHGSFP